MSGRLTYYSRHTCLWQWMCNQYRPCPEYLPTSPSKRHLWTSNRIVLSLSTWRILADCQTQAQIFPDFIMTWGVQIHIINIGGKDTNIIQLYKHECNTHSIPRQNTWISDCRWRISSMTTGEKTSFPGEIAIHIDIKYHVASKYWCLGRTLTSLISPIL